jgi:transcriptional regulator with XRE-family HTH domain
MAVRDRRLDRAIASARTLAEASRREFRLSRIGAGLSRREVARAAGMSASQGDRFERGASRDIRLGQLCRLAAAVGLVPTLRFYPDADPVRDAGQVRLLARLRSRISAALRFRTEVPILGRTDRRAWDAVADGAGCVDAFEVETRLADVQATQRRVMLKLRDDSSVRHAFLVVADTRSNRAALGATRELLRADFPLDTRAVFASFSSGHCPGAGGIIVL